MLVDNLSEHAPSNFQCKSKEPECKLKLAKFYLKVKERKLNLSQQKYQKKNLKNKSKYQKKNQLKFNKKDKCMFYICLCLDSKHIPRHIELIHKNTTKNQKIELHQRF